MKKSILRLGKPLKRDVQQLINGGKSKFCENDSNCEWPLGCCIGLCMTPERYDEICGS